MLPEGAHVETVYLDPSTDLLAGSKGSSSTKLLIECGTIPTDVILAVGKAVEESGVAHFADGPVSGGPMGAEAGNLTFMSAPRRRSSRR